MKKDEKRHTATHSYSLPPTLWVIRFSRKIFTVCRIEVSQAWSWAEIFEESMSSTMEVSGCNGEKWPKMFYFTIFTLSHGVWMTWLFSLRICWRKQTYNGHDWSLLNPSLKLFFVFRSKRVYKDLKGALLTHAPFPVGRVFVDRPVPFHPFHPRFRQPPPCSWGRRSCPPACWTCSTTRRWRVRAPATRYVNQKNTIC